MELENLKLDSPENSGEKIDKNEAKSRLQEVADIQKALWKMNASKYPDIEAKLKNKPQLQKDIWNFIETAANGKLDTSMMKLNASEFDKDWKEGLSKFEFEKFLQSADTTVQQIILLGSSQELSRIYNESSNPSWYEIDKQIAKNLDLQKFLFWEKGDNTFVDSLLQKAGDMTPEQREKIGNELFSLTSFDSYKHLGLYIAKDIGDSLESIMRFLLNMPAGIALLPRYLNYRYDRNFWTQKQITEADIKIKELTWANPSLEILELLWEKGIDMIKSLYQSMKSWKIKDISMILTTIAWLIAWWAWAVRLWMKGVQKVSTGTRVAEIAWGVERWASKLQQVAWRVDSVVSTAWTSELLRGAKIWAPSSNIESRVFSPDEMMNNSKLVDVERLQKAEEYLWVKLTDIQKEALISAHNYGAEGGLAYSQWEKIVKGKKLMESGFTREQTQILLDSALAWAPDKIASGIALANSNRIKVDIMRLSSDINNPESKLKLLSLIDPDNSGWLLKILKTEWFIIDTSLRHQISNICQRVFWFVDIKLHQWTAQEVAHSLESLWKNPRFKSVFQEYNIQKAQLLAEKAQLSQFLWTLYKLHPQTRKNSIQSFISNQLDAKKPSLVVWRESLNIFQQWKLKEAFVKMETWYFEAREGVAFIRDNTLFVLSYKQLKEVWLNVTQLWERHTWISPFPSWEDVFRIGTALLFSR
jgi:hypothetical protein